MSCLIGGMIHCLILENVIANYVITNVVNELGVGVSKLIQIESDCLFPG